MTQPSPKSATESSPPSKRMALTNYPWLWSFVAAILVWGVTVVVAEGRGAGATLTAALNFATFYVIVGAGQMFVVTMGPGNVDLSIPATIALAGAVSMRVMDGAGAMIPLGLLSAVGIGALAGCGNFLLIYLLRIPPIIATLSASFILQSLAIAFGRGLRIRPPDSLGSFATARAFGIPWIAVITLLLTIGLAYLLQHSIYGRSVLALGQNPRAAQLSGLKVNLTRFLSYALCAALAGLTGLLLAAFSGGASLDMGNQFLLSSIAVVVIGGTNIAGGDANVPGLWGASLFLFLVVTMLNSLGVSNGLRQVLTGLIIIAIITASSRRTT